MGSRSAAIRSPWSEPDVAWGRRPCHCLDRDPLRRVIAPISAFTFPDLAVHHADLGVHDGDLAVHDAAISAFTFSRCVQLSSGVLIKSLPESSISLRSDIVRLYRSVADSVASGSDRHTLDNRSLQSLCGP
ncbi:MAG TPA: hypothetical protein VMF89_05660, partial [Polyangiales bacterium]|nr:hypothetical protein [Polyangiales bacterium]